MSPTHEARCDEHKARNARHYLAFSVVEPGELPGEFSLQPSPKEYERLAEHSTESTDDSLRVGVVPVRFDDGWEIDWETLESE